jgi:hypothetical protein
VRFSLRITHIIVIYRGKLVTVAGAFVDPNADALNKYEQWIGNEVSYVAVHADRSNWTKWEDSVGWASHLWNELDRPVRWSIPMFAKEGNLEDAADGDYNGHYKYAAETLAAYHSDQSQIVVRVGEEFNGGWMPWAAKGREGDFIQAYKNFVDTFEKVSDKFVFEWNVGVGNYGMNPEDAYPGDEYVDIVSMDFYYDTKWYGTDPLAAWNKMETQTNGLQWLEDFAAEHGKPTAYGEWAVNSKNAGPFIEKAAEWFEDNNALYQFYWNTDSNFAGKLSDGQYPGAAKAYLDAFAGNTEPLVQLAGVDLSTTDFL